MEDYRRGKKARLRLSAKRKKNPLLKKGKKWPKSQKKSVPTTNNEDLVNTPTQSSIVEPTASSSTEIPELKASPATSSSHFVFEVPIKLENENDAATKMERTRRHAQSKEISIAKKTPSISKKKFYSKDNRLQGTFEECAIEKILAAGEEEKELTIQDKIGNKESKSKRVVRPKRSNTSYRRQTKR